MATKANPPKGPISNLPAGPEHRQRSSNQFCRCGHARSFTLQGLRHICRDPKCECVKHDTAVTPPKAKLRVLMGRCLDCGVPNPGPGHSHALIEPSPNAMARDAAVALLKRALQSPMWTVIRLDVEKAIYELEAIS